MNRRDSERMDVFGGGDDDSMESFANDIYGAPGGGAAELDTGRIVAKPIAIARIWPDVTQPRRAIPHMLRGEWDGNPDHALAVLEHWRKGAENQIKKKINPVQHIKEYNADGFEIDDSATVAASYLRLLALAASVYRDGLINPVTAALSGSRYVLETGERRLLAHHLLAHFSDRDYTRIPVQVVPDVDPWRQAKENSVREELNAIEQARQLAKLIMDIYRDQDGVQFETYQEIVQPAGCDRAFYAQVADGYRYPIPNAFKERVQNAMGLTSYARLSQYRRLLRLNDEEWMEADERDWSEYKIRTEILSPDDPPALPGGGNLTAVKIDDPPALPGGGNLTAVKIDDPPALPGGGNLTAVKIDDSRTFAPVGSASKQREPDAYTEPDIKSDILHRYGPLVPDGPFDEPGTFEDIDHALEAWREQHAQYRCYADQTKHRQIRRLLMLIKATGGDEARRAAMYLLQKDQHMAGNLDRRDYTSENLVERTGAAMATIQREMERYIEMLFDLSNEIVVRGQTYEQE